MTNAKQGGPLHAYGKLYPALHDLARHPGRVRERLVEAFKGGLSVVHDGDLPTTEMRRQWQAIRSRVAGTSTTDAAGTFEAAINVLSEDEASRVVDDIVDVAYALNRWLDQHEPTRQRR